MSEQSFKLLFQTDLETNVKELEYWSNKFKGKIPKSIKNRIEKLKYVSSMQYKAEQEKRKKDIEFDESKRPKSVGLKQDRRSPSDEVKQIIKETTKESANA